MRIGTIPALALVGFGLFGQTAHTTYQTATGLITVYYQFLDLNPGKIETHANFKGEPVTLTDTGTGATIIGRIVDVVLLNSKKGTTEIESALAEGDAHITIDTAISDDTREKLAAKAGKPYARPNETQVIKADSEKFSYAVSKGTGTLVVPGPWTYNDDSKTNTLEKQKEKLVHVSETNTYHATGSSGNMAFVLKPDGQLDKPTGGKIEGPVKFSMKRRVEIQETQEITLTNITGTCDQVDIDLTTTPGTIIATGHVEMDGDGDGLVGHTSCSKFVVFVDKNNKPISYQTSGAPAVSKVKSKDGTH